MTEAAPPVSPRYTGRMHLGSESHRTPVVADGVLGMIIFVITEVMLFAGMISAFLIIRASAMVWPPRSTSPSRRRT